MGFNEAYYEAKGRSLEGCRRYLTDHRAAHEAWHQFKDAQHGDRIVENGARLHGLSFKDFVPNPDLWRKETGHAWYVPNRKTKAGKELVKTIAALPKQPTGWSANEYLNMPLGPKDFMGICDTATGKVRPLAQIAGGPSEFLIVVTFLDGQAPQTPPDAVELTASQYVERRRALGLDKEI